MVSRFENDDDVRGNPARFQAARNRSIAARRRAAVEALEGRVLFATDFLLAGNQLTTTVNGVQGQPQTVANVNNVTITGDSGVNRVTVQNFAGTVSIDGRGGADVITVHAGSGGTVNVHDTAPSNGNPSTLIVRAPTTVQAAVTVGTSRVTVGADQVNYDSTVSVISLIGQLFSNGDNLTLNGSSAAEAINISGSTLQVGTGPTIYYSTFQSLAVNGGGGGDVITVAGDSVPTTVSAASGNVAFVVNSNSVPLTLNGGSGTNAFTVNSSSGPLTLNGGSGPNTANVNGSSSGMTVNGGASSNALAVNGNSASLTVNGAGTSNAVTVNANSGTLTVNGNTGADAYTVNATTGTVNLRGGAGPTTYAVTTPTLAPVNVTGGSGAGALTFGGTPLRDVFTVTPTTLNAGTGSTVTYTGLTSVAVNGIGGADDFTLQSTATPTTLNGGTDASLFNIKAASASVTVNTGTLPGVVNVGSNAPTLTGNTLAGITGPLTVVGNGADTLNLDDSAGLVAKTGVLSATGLTGISTGNVAYSGIATLNLKLGTAADNLSVVSTALGTTTNVTAGTGPNTFKLGSLAPASGGVTDNLRGTLNLTGGGTDSLTVDDSGNATGKSATLVPASLTGLSPAAVNFTGVSSLAIALGTGADTLDVTNTIAGSTSINAGPGNDAVTVAATTGTTAIATGTGTDAVNLRTIAAAATVTSTGTTTLTVGSQAPAGGGVLDGIDAAITFNGNATDTLTIDDSAQTLPTTSALSLTSVTGLGLPAGIAYGNIAALNLLLGAAANTLAVSNTAAATVTTIAGGASADTVTLQQVAGLTNVNTAGGADTINVNATLAVTTINAGTGADTVNLGSNAPAANSALANIAAAVGVTGDGTARLNVDDSGSPTAKTATLSATALTGAAPAAITYAGIGTLDVKLGSGADTLAIVGTHTATTTNVNTGIGNDAVNVRATGGATNVTTGTGDNAIAVGATAPTGPTVMANVAGPLSFTGSGTDNLLLLNDADTLPRVATLSPTGLTGVSPADIAFTGILNLALKLGSANDQLTVTDTVAGSVLLDTGSGSDTLTLNHVSGETTVTTGDGDDTINFRAAAAHANVNTGTGTNVVTLGSDAPATGTGNLDGITARVLVTGGGTDTLNVDDAGNTVAKNGTLTASQISGLTDDVIDYVAIDALNIGLGAGGDAFNIDGTNAGTPTSLNAGGGNDMVRVRANVSALTIAGGDGSDTVRIGSGTDLNEGVVDDIAAPVSVGGGGNVDDVLVVDDGAQSAGKTGTLTPTTLTGVAPAIITYSGLAAMGVLLGDGVDTLTVTNTAAATLTGVYAGAGADAVTIQNNAGPTTVNTGEGSDNVNVRRTGGETSIDTGEGGGTDTVRVGTTAPTAGGVTDHIAGELTVTGHGTDVLRIDDSGNGLPKTATLTDESLTGLSPAAIKYVDIAALAIALGAGGDTLAIDDTAAATETSIVGGAGVERFHVRGLSGPTTIDTGAAADTIVLGSNSPAANGTLDRFAAPLTLVGRGTDELSVDDTGSSVARTGTLTPTTLDLGPADVTYGGVAKLALDLGSAADAFTVDDSAPGADLEIDLRGGNDTLLIRDVSGPTIVETGAGSDRVDVRAIGAVTTIGNGSPDGADTFNLGSLAPGTGGVVDGLDALLTIAGHGGDTLNVDDTASTAGKTGTLTATHITGLATAGIDYAGLDRLNLNLGSGNDTFTVSNTHVGTPTTLNANDGDDTVNVMNTASFLAINTGSGADAINVTTTGAEMTLNAGDDNDEIDVQNTGAATTIEAGAGDDDMVIHDTGGATTLTAGIGDDDLTVHATGGLSTLDMGAGDDAVTIHTTGDATTLDTGNGDDAVDIYAAGGTTTVSAGTGDDVVNVRSADASMTINTGTGQDLVRAGSIVPQTGGTLAGFAAGLNVVGGGESSLDLDDSGNALAYGPVTLTDASVTGLSPAPISYAGLAGLDVRLGDGGGTVRVRGTSAGGSGGAGAGTTLHGGDGDDTFALAPASGSLPDALQGRISFDGNGGDNALSVNDSADATDRHVTITPRVIAGLGGLITYNDVGVLGLLLGAGDDAITVNELDPNVETSIQAGGGFDAATINIAGDYNGGLSLGGVELGELAVAGDLNGTLPIDGGLTTIDVGGDLNGAVAVSHHLDRLIIGGDLAGTVSVAGYLKALDVGGDLTGNVAVAGDMTAFKVGNNLSGEVNVAGPVKLMSVGENFNGDVKVDGSLEWLTVGGSFVSSITVGSDIGTVEIGGDLSGSFDAKRNLASIEVDGNLTGVLDVLARLGTLRLGGAMSGTLAGGDVGTAFAGSAIADADGIVFSLTDGELTRSVVAEAASTNSLASVRFAVAYDGITSMIPQAAIRIANPDAANARFDLLLTAPAVTAFDLSRVDTANGEEAGVRNIAVSGSILGAVTGPQAEFFGYEPAVESGNKVNAMKTVKAKKRSNGTEAGIFSGVQLPADALAAVAARDALHAGTIYAKSIQGVAFSTFVDSDGTKTRAPAARKNGKGFKINLLTNALAKNAETRKAITRVLDVTEPLTAIVGHEGRVGMWAGGANGKYDPRAIFFADQSIDEETIRATVSFQADGNDRASVERVAFEGDGGAVDTYRRVRNVSSTGPLGDVLLRAGKTQVLHTITAPSMFGSLNVFGGTVIGPKPAAEI